MKTLLLQFDLASIQQQLQDLPFLAEMLGEALLFIGRLLGALFLLLLGRWIAKWIAKGSKKLLQKLGIDSLADRLVSIDLFAKLPTISPSAIFAKLIYYLIFFIFFWISADILGVEALSDMISRFFDYLPTLFSALVVFLAGVFLADFLKKLVRTACESLRIPAAGLISNFVFYFLFINIVMITLSQAGIQTKAIEENISIILAGIVAAFAIGYGFASRPVLSNVLAAYYSRNRVKVGDRISIGDAQGEIIRMDNISLTLEAEGRRIVVPVSKLLTETYELLD